MPVPRSVTATRSTGQGHLAGILLVAAFAVVYLWRLDRVPVHLLMDEGNFGSQGASLATTGRDLNGTAWPLFVLIKDPLRPDGDSDTWYQPFLFYAIAAVLTVVPTSEWAIRLPTGLIALADIWLVYLIGCRVFSRRSYALLAALMMGMMPAHLIMSRRALDYICPAPFALTWLYGVTAFRDSRQVRYLVLAGLALGLGLYTYIASWALMPFLLVLTPFLLRDTGVARKASLALVMGFAVPLAALAPWVASHPGGLQTLFRNRLPDTSSPALIQRFMALADFDLGHRVSLYWSYFNPSFLFFAGGADLTQATSEVGVFLLPMAVLLPLGVRRLARRRSGPDLALLAMFFFGPVPIVVTLPDTAGSDIPRAMVMLPAAALIAAYAVEEWWSRGHKALRGLTLVLLLALPLQYAGFLRDYFSGYQQRTARLMDPLNIAGVAEVLAARPTADTSAIYFPDNVQNASWVWKFFTVKMHRPDLWARTRPFDPASVDAEGVPPGSMLVLQADDPAANALRNHGGYALVAVVPGVDGEAAARILGRTP